MCVCMCMCVYKTHIHILACFIYKLQYIKSSFIAKPGKIGLKTPT